MPIRSYSLLSSHTSKLMIKSIFSVVLTAPIPNRRRALTIPMPRSSIKWRIFLGEEPTNVFAETRRISTASSAIKRCPRLINSMAVSLFPTPLSPTIKMPSPYTSTNTPCLVTRGASCTFKKEINAASNTHVISSELNNGTSYFSAMVINSSTGCKLRQNITAGGCLESNASNTSIRFSLSHSSSK